MWYPSRHFSFFFSFLREHSKHGQSCVMYRRTVQSKELKQDTLSKIAEIHPPFRAINSFLSVHILRKIRPLLVELRLGAE